MGRLFINRTELNTAAAAIFLVFFAVGWVERLEAAVTASSLAIVGYDDDQDSFSLLALDHLGAGEEIYFTNNGWSGSQGKFNGADVTQGAGNESVIKLTLNQSIAKGSVISTKITGGAWEWTKAGLIPGQVGGFAEFSDLAIDYESDQIYAFQALSGNPLLNPTNFIYALHFGSTENPDFSDSVDALTGDVPPGLSITGKTAFAHTTLSFHGDADGNHSAWGLNMSSPAIQSLLLSGTKTQWLNAIANSSNWGEGEPTSVFNLAPAPEPNRLFLAGLGLASLIMRRSRPDHTQSNKLWLL